MGRFWRAYEAIDTPIDFIFTVVSPLPFAVPFGIGAALLCSVFFGVDSGVVAIGSFAFGYLVGGLWQLALRLLLRKP